MSEECRVIQVTNVSPTVTRDQMQTLFGFIGKIDDLVLYPLTETTNISRMCFVKFAESEAVGVALHLSNTAFIDRALSVLPVPDGKIPDEPTALKMLTGNAGLLESTDDVRRTIYVSNIDQSITPEMLLQLFGAEAGEVKYIRMAGEDGLSVQGAFIEFSQQVSVMRALALTGQMVGGRPIRVAPANSSIAKPNPASLTGTASKEVEDAMRKVNEVPPVISAVLNTDSKRRGSRSRSRSRSHRSRSHRSRSKRRSPSRGSRSRKRSRSRSRRRSRSRSRRKSKSPKRRRSRSPRRHRSRSGSRGRIRRHRSRSRSPRSSRSHRSQSRSKDKKKSASKSPGGEKKSSNRDVDRVKKESSSSHHLSSRSPGRSARKRSRSRSKSASRPSKRDRRGRSHDRKKRGDNGSGSPRKKSKRAPSGADVNEEDIVKANMGRADEDSVAESDGNNSD